jgi:hypothetical protein
VLDKTRRSSRNKKNSLAIDTGAKLSVSTAILDSVADRV